jgi:hypothetical protein
MVMGMGAEEEEEEEEDDGGGTEDYGKPRETTGDCY